MTLDDLISFLEDETERQTLTPQAIRRCILLAADLGRNAGQADALPPPAAPPCALCRVLRLPKTGVDFYAWAVRVDVVLAQPCVPCGQRWDWHTLAHPHTRTGCAGVLS